MMKKEELEKLLVKFEEYLPMVSASNNSKGAKASKTDVSKRPGRPKKYDDRLVLFLIALREKYKWSLRELEKKAREILPKGVEIPDFSSIHYRIRKMKDYIEEIRPKLIKVVPDLEVSTKNGDGKEASSSASSKNSASKSQKDTKKTQTKAKSVKKTGKVKSKR